MLSSILRRVLRWPFWLYVLLGVGVFWASEQVHKDSLRSEAEKAIALQQAAPELTDLGQFSRAQHLGPADEVHVQGWINTDYNYHLVKRTNGMKTGERHMWVLFGTDDTAQAEVARAAVVLEVGQKDAFMTYLSGAIGGIHGDKVLLDLNGFGKTSDSFSKVAMNALRNEGLRPSADFIYIKPFIEGRAAALAPAELPGKNRYIGWAIGMVLMLLGVVKFRLRRQSSKVRAQVREPEKTRPVVLPKGIDADSPLARIQRRQMAAQAGETEGAGADDGFRDSPIQSTRGGGLRRLAKAKAARDPGQRKLRGRLLGGLVVAAVVLSAVSGTPGLGVLVVVVVLMNWGLYAAFHGIGRTLTGMAGMVTGGTRREDPFARLARQVNGR